jgi:AcrR family transcriptional regulator
MKPSDTSAKKTTTATAAKRSAPSTRATPRPYHHGDLRDALITHALALVASEGTRALTVRELARRAGVSHSAPAHHFGDRTGILAALAAQGFDRLAQAMSREVKGASDPEERLYRLGLGYVRFALAEPALMELMFHPDLEGTARFPALEQASRFAYEQLAAGVKSAAPHLAEPARADLALAAWSLVHGFAQLERAGAVRRRQGHHAPRATARRLVELLMHAAAPR